MILREKILLGVVGVAATAAAIYHLSTTLGSEDELAPRKVIDYASLTGKVQASLSEGKFTWIEESISKAVWTELERDPLKPKPLVIDRKSDDGNQSAEGEDPLPKYLGFIEVGTTTIAIIDGEDYRPKEMLEGDEYFLAGIWPDHVMLIRQGSVDPIKIPIEKEQVLAGPKFEKKRSE